MIVVMKPNSTEDKIQLMTRRVEELGLKAHVIVGTERTVIAAIGDKRNGEKEALEACDEVEQVVPILAPYKVASVEAKPEPTVVEVLNFKAGRVTQGASTITQQLARNLFLSLEKTYTRKIKEIFLALKIERELYTKELVKSRTGRQVLTDYLLV